MTVVRVEPGIGLLSTVVTEKFDQKQLSDSEAEWPHTKAHPLEKPGWDLKLEPKQRPCGNVASWLALLLLFLEQPRPAQSGTTYNKLGPPTSTNHQSRKCLLACLEESTPSIEYTSSLMTLACVKLTEKL